MVRVFLGSEAAIEEGEEKGREYSVLEEEIERSGGFDWVGGCVFLGQLVHAYAVAGGPGRIS